MDHHRNVYSWKQTDGDFEQLQSKVGVCFQNKQFKRANVNISKNELKQLLKVNAFYSMGELPEATI